MAWLLDIRRHHRLRTLLSSYIDGQLKEEAKRHVEEHLPTCGECRWELETLRMTVGLLRDAEPLPVPRSFAIREPLPRHTYAPTYLWAMRAATSVAALLLVALLVGDVAGLLSQGEAMSREAPESPGFLRTFEEPTITAMQESAPVPTIQALEAAAPTALPAAAPVPRPAVPAPTAAPAPTAPSVTTPTPQPAPLPEGSDVLAKEFDQTPVPPSTDAQRAAEAPETGAVPLLEVSEEEGGLSLPLRQLEIGIGVGLVLLGGATVWLARRRRRMGI